VLDASEIEQRSPAPRPQAFSLDREGLNPRTGESIKVNAGRIVRVWGSPVLKTSV